ncbi:MAG TPA: molybdopterin cofactor-binding domain-containing protein, partial [Opitutaceae bacterium]|nr:molybdopterin cofactor-binding domain-containing protein [Opitutaceae bacterium]
MSDFPRHSQDSERDESSAPPALHRFGMARRDFFKVLGSGVMILLVLDRALAQEESGGTRRRGGGSSRRPQELAAWLHIGEDGTVTVFTGKVEVGQNIRTSLTQVVAEELHAPIGSIRLLMGDTDLTPFDAGTFGSRTTPDMAVQLRKVSATAREALIDLAAERWKADRTSLIAVDCKIIQSGTNRSISFGELTKGEKLLKQVLENAPTTPASAWKIAGTSVLKIDGHNFVTGKHRYTPDLTVAEMLHGRVLRPVAFGATLSSLDAKDAEALRGVTVVREGDFIGVTAPSESLAAHALSLLRAEWKMEAQPSEKDFFDSMAASASVSAESDANGSSSDSDSIPSEKTRRGVYTVAYIAHAPLEPRAALAEWKGDKLTVWTGTQRPFGVRSELAQAFRIPEERIRVIMPDTGSGYGGKHTGDAAIEAARLAKEAGKPVKLVWTREEEFTWAYFRPAGLIKVTGGTTADGKLTHWDFHNYNSGPSGIQCPYDVPKPKTEYHPAHSPLRQGSYRALASTANNFARESHIDELAREVKIDPLEFRLKNMKDPRIRAVLQAAADEFGWGAKKSGPDRGVGIAAGLEKGSYLATCVEVSIDRSGGDVRVIRVVQAFECGAILNPEHLRSLNEGAIVQGIGGALFEAIKFENGKILNPRFAQYRVPRFSGVPTLKVVLLDRKDLPSAGAGETPIIGIAPAIGNAICDATGVRLRSLPLVPNGWEASLRGHVSTIEKIDSMSGHSMA